MAQTITSPARRQMPYSFHSQRPVANPQSGEEYKGPFKLEKGQVLAAWLSPTTWLPVCGDRPRIVSVR